MRKLHLICFIVLLTFSLPFFAKGEEPPPPTRHLKIALVLSGGGARGIAHIGVLKALEELHVPLDMIVGTSMGAIAGGLYSTGYSPEQLEEMVVQAPWDTVFTNETSRSDMPYRQKPDKKNYFVNIGLDYKHGFILPRSVIQAKKLELRLRAWTVGAGDDFSKFKIPFRAVATDIATGQTVVLSRGDIARSLRASMSVPGAFEPVKINGKMLVDGGVSDQLPVDVAKKMGADVIIAVNVGTPLETSGELRSVIDITNQLTGILTNKSVIDAEKLLTPGDVLITPELKDLSNMDFTKAAAEIELGVQATFNARDKLSKYAVTDDVFSEYIHNQRRRQDSPYEFIKVQTPYGDYKEEIEIQDQDILNIIDTKLIGRRIFRNRQYELADFSVIEINGKKGLLIKTELSDLGPDVIRFGFETEDDFEGDAYYNVLFGYTMNKINRFGADWKNEVQFGQTNRFFTEFYQPFGKRLWMPFIAPWFEAKSSSIYVYDDTEKIAEYRTRDITGELDIGVQLGCVGEIRLGMTWNNFKISPKIAPSDWPDENIDDAAYDAKLKIDTLDNLNFPQHGYSLYAEARLSREYLGADISYDMYRAEASIPIAFGKSVIMPLVKAGSCQGLDLDLQYFGYFTLGGFQNLSGLYPDQLLGDQLLFGELVYSYNIWKLPRALGNNVYAGFSVEAGNVWDTAKERSLGDLTAAGSVFVGLETIIGPFYLAYGMAEKGQSAFYFYLGHMF